MILETRQLVTTDEIRAIELKCRKPACGGILHIDLRPGSLNAEEQCPRCKRTWWTPEKPSTAFELLKALTDSRHIHDESRDVPTVTMILPGPADSAK